MAISKCFSKAKFKKHAYLQPLIVSHLSIKISDISATVFFDNCVTRAPSPRNAQLSHLNLVYSQSLIYQWPFIKTVTFARVYQQYRWRLWSLINLLKKSPTIYFSRLPAHRDATLHHQALVFFHISFFYVSPGLSTKSLRGNTDTHSGADTFAPTRLCGSDKFAKYQHRLWISGGDVE